MAKRLKYILFFVLMSFTAFGQREWIDYNQTYYKIGTDRDGIYRVNFSALTSAGINPNTIDPRNIRLYHRGEEIAIHVEGEQDGRFDPTDYIVFFGKKNDGLLDDRFFEDPSHNGNNRYNMHSDSTAFFLAITPGTPGRRMAIRPQAAGNIPQIEQYQTFKDMVFFENYNLGRIYSPGIRLSAFEEGQGWVSSAIAKNNPRTIIWNELGNVPSSGEVLLEIGLTGRSETPHLAQINVGPNSVTLRQVQEISFDNYQAVHYSIQLQTTDFNPAGSITVRVATAGSGAVDNISIAYMRLTYPKTPESGDFSHEVFMVPEGNRQVRLGNVISDYIALDISDPINPERVSVRAEGDERLVQVGVNNRPSKVHVENVIDIGRVERMTRVRFRDFLSQSADYIIIANKELRKSTDKYNDPVRAYAEHRASRDGGSYDTLMVNIDELFDQFTYGEKTPLAIYEFLRAYYPVHKPEFLLLVGRSTGIFTNAREGGRNFFYRQNPAIFTFQDMIPPAGYPYADNNYSIGLDPENPFITAVSIGRIPARNAQQVGEYLDKVKEKDMLGVSEDWQKNLVHLSGGVSAFELNRYFNFLNGYKDIAEGVYMGARVNTYRKRSNSTIELINISDEVNTGTSLITFFGHGAPTIIDIEIGFASDPTMGYQNQGKYPIVLMNGCDAGNAFGNAYTFGEDWVLTPSKGASNFLAHANIGIDVFLRRFSESFYIKAFSDSSMIYKPLGEVRKASEKWFYSRFGTSVINRSHVEQFVMLGDPAVRMFPADKADYALENTDVFLESYDGEPFNALADSLKLTFVLRNLGRVDLDSVNLKVSRRLPDGTLQELPEEILPPVFRKDTLTIAIPNQGFQSFGENLISISVNTNRAVPEMTFGNNSITVSKFVPLSGTIHLIPENFGIVNQRNINLIAQIPGKSVEDRTLVIQLDNQSDFNSALRRENRITTANLAIWELDLFQNIPIADSVTFYWRSRFLEPREGESEEWTMGSFSYISNGPEGWTQRTIPQLATNTLKNLEIDPVKREWKYEDTNLNFKVFTFGNRTDSLTFRNTQFYLEGVPYIIDNVLNANSRLCPNGSLGLVAFEQKSLTPYLVIPVPGFDILDGRSCGRVPQVIQSITNNRINQSGQTMLIEYIDGLREGDFVVVFSVGNVTFEQWPDEAFEKMREIGANEALLRNLKNGDPYILFGKKGMRPGEAIEVVAQKDIELATNEQIIEFETDLQGFFTSGSILTPRIGPAAQWEQFFNRVKERDWFDEELAYFDVIGVRPTGEEQVIFSNIQEGEVDLSTINPEQFPFLRIRYLMDDENSTAPAQLDRWQVNYTGVPEAVLIFKNKESQMEIQEGIDVDLNFEFINISTLDFPDSIVVEWEFKNLTTRKNEKFSKKIPALKAGEKHEFSIEFNSIGRAGRVQVEVFANPRIIQEQTFRNNFIDLGAYFVVVPDENRAILDVHFDGIYIMDGDLVSPSVMITSLLKNETTLIYKKDTIGLELFLKRPCEGCQFERVNFSSPKVTWTEASENSSFRIEYQPGPLEDGMYTFRVTTEELGVDKPYEINFEVVNESSITNFYPYPNPFSTSTRFVFTVTGSEVPDQVKIQIMTVSGRVVREINQDELGPLRIGNNISEFAWDGRDEFGDQLANGVYIYRVLVRKNGQFVEPRATAGDKAFKQGYGKMYLLR